MTMAESLQKAIDYMEEHLLEPITTEDIARQSNISPYHFQRTFMILTERSVGEYLRHRRLTLAAEELLHSPIKVIELAGKYGYDTPESFTKAFRKQHGVTPSEARKGMGQLQSYNRMVIQLTLKGAEPMKYRMVEREAFQTIGVKRQFVCAKEPGIPGVEDYWAQANQDGTTEKLSQLNEGEIKGLLGVTDNYDEEHNTVDYWIAVEHNGDGSPEFEKIEFPASKWVVFEVRGPIPEAIIDSWKQIYSEWFPSHNVEPASLPPLEVYKEADLQRADTYSEIWFPVL